MPTDFPSVKRQAPCRVMHLVRPAEGGMRAQVASLIAAAPKDSTLLAAPPEVIAALNAAGDVAASFPLPEKIGGLRQQLTVGWAAGEWAKPRGPALLHGHGLRWLPLYVTAALRARLPLVLTLHNMLPSPETLTWQERLALKIGLGWTTKIIAVSRAVADSASAVAPGVRDRLRVIPNGIDLARFAKSGEAGPRAATRAALQVPDKAPVVVCVARLAPEKNLGTLLEAVERLTPSLPHLHLLLVGDGPWRPTLEHQTRMLGLTERVHFLGVRSDIPDLLEAADLFCLPSRTEGLGIAAIEAMASGLPVIASRVGGLPEVVEDGVTGLLITPSDTDALAEALRTLLTDPGKAGQMASAGRARAEKCFDSRTMIEATQALYAEAVRHRGHP